MWLCSTVAKTSWAKQSRVAWLIAIRLTLVLENLKKYSHINNTIQDLGAIMRYWGFDLAVTLAGIASGFWVRFKCREADLDKTGGAWGGRFFPLFSRLQRLYFHRTPREPLPVQATNNCVVAPEQRGPRTIFSHNFCQNQLQTLRLKVLLHTLIGFRAD